MIRKSWSPSFTKTLHYHASVNVPMVSRVSSPPIRPTQLKALPGGLLWDSRKTPPPSRQIIKADQIWGRRDVRTAWVQPYFHRCDIWWFIIFARFCWSSCFAVVDAALPLAGAGCWGADERPNLLNKPTSCEWSPKKKYCQDNKSGGGIKRNRPAWFKTQDRRQEQWTRRDMFWPESRRAATARLAGWGCRGDRDRRASFRVSACVESVFSQPPGSFISSTLQVLLKKTLMISSPLNLLATFVLNR